MKKKLCGRAGYGKQDGGSGNVEISEGPFFLVGCIHDAITTHPTLCPTTPCIRIFGGYQHPKWPIASNLPADTNLSADLVRRGKVSLFVSQGLYVGLHLFGENG